MRLPRAGLLVILTLIASLTLMMAVEADAPQAPQRQDPEWQAKQAHKQTKRKAKRAHQQAKQREQRIERRDAALKRALEQASRQPVE